RSVPTGVYPRTRHDALPISVQNVDGRVPRRLGQRREVVGEGDDLRHAWAREDQVGLPSRAEETARQEGQADDGQEDDPPTPPSRSEEHTSELQSREKLVCRL